MTQPNISGNGLVALALIALVCRSPFASGARAVEFHDVKYFFDDVETFRSDIPRSGIREKVAVRGRVVTHMLPVQCVKGPCPPVRGIFFQDVDDESYRFPIFGGNNLLRRLKIGNVYVLGGMLEKSVDAGRKTVFISNFIPETIIRDNAKTTSNTQNQRACLTLVRTNVPEAPRINLHLWRHAAQQDVRRHLR